VSDINVGFERLIRLFRDGREFLLAAEPARLVLYEEIEGSPRRELGSLPVARGQLDGFFEVLRQALAPNPREKLASDPGPLEPFQPPPEER
jgi:hypothetical protein